MSALDREFFKIELPSNRPYQVIGFGLNAVDWLCTIPHYPPHNTKVQIDSMYRMGGGQTATACAMLGRYGVAVRYIGRVGDDEIGRFSRQDLGRESMDVQIETVPDSVSQFAIILVDRPTGERTILWDRDPKLQYAAGDVPRELIIEGQILHIDGHDQAASIQAARWAREAGMKVSIDIDKTQSDVEEVLELLDFGVLSLNFIQSFARTDNWQEALRYAARFIPGFVAVTRGRDGVAAIWEDEIVEVPGYHVLPVDTTGAGDVFHAGFLYGVLQQWSIGECLRFANAAGALSCTRYGARGGIPKIEEVRRLMEKGQGV